MSGQVWGTNSLGGFMYSDSLSDVLRMALQPMTRFRQFCDIKENKGESAGEKLFWNTYSDIADAADEAGLSETDTLPESNYTITQNNLTVTEFGNAVPFTKKLDNLSKHPVTEIVHKVLKNDARKTLDRAAYNQFNQTLLAVGPTSGSSATDIVVSETGEEGLDQNNIVLKKAHVAKIIDNVLMERDIPPYDGENYVAIGRPGTFSDFKTELEGVYQYVDAGFGLIYNGEVGRYRGCRFVNQTNVPSAGWTNAKSDQVFFFGSDTVAEGIVIPEEIRGKIPTDYGRSRGVAWYYLGGFGICHTDVNEARIVKWGSDETP